MPQQEKKNASDLMIGVAGGGVSAMIVFLSEIPEYLFSHHTNCKLLLLWILKIIIVGSLTMGVLNYIEKKGGLK